MNDKPRCGKGYSQLLAKQDITEMYINLVTAAEANAAKTVLERPFMERLMAMPPESLSAVAGLQSTLYHDFTSGYKNILFYGIEAQLLAFDALIFTVVDAELNNFPLAAFITWFVYQCVCFSRAYLGERNIAQKSLIDECFFM